MKFSDLAPNSLNDDIEAILQPKHSTSGKTKCYLSGGCIGGRPCHHPCDIYCSGDLAGGGLDWVSPLWTLQQVRVVEPWVLMKSRGEGHWQTLVLIWAKAWLASPFCRAFFVLSLAADISHSWMGWGKAHPCTEACWPSYLNCCWTKSRMNCTCWLNHEPNPKCFPLTMRKPSLLP